MGLPEAIGAIALCVLVLLAFAVMTANQRRDSDALRLPSVREGRVALSPPGRGAPSPTPARLPSSSGRRGGGDGH
jgi:hypothetical protein